MSLRGTKGVGIPTVLLHEGEGLAVTIETKSGHVYKGIMETVEDTMNTGLRDVTVTDPDGNKASMQKVFLRGSQIVFVIFPDVLKKAPMFERLRKASLGLSVAGGLGRGRQAAIQEGLLEVRTCSFFFPWKWDLLALCARLLSLLYRAAARKQGGFGGPGGGFGGPGGFGRGRGGPPGGPMGGSSGFVPGAGGGFGGPRPGFNPAFGGGPMPPRGPMGMAGGAPMGGVGGAMQGPPQGMPGPMGMAPRGPPFAGGAGMAAPPMGVGRGSGAVTPAWMNQR
jgi:small nuclear ribonucleoprotein D3